MGNVIISPNIVKESARINNNGDIINPKTKQIIERNESGYMPTTEELAGIAAKPQNEPVAQDKAKEPLSIQAQIEAKEKELIALKAMKKEQIEQMKKQLAELEK